MVAMCCFRCDLRKRCTVIGSLWLVFSVVFAVGGMVMVGMFQIAEHEYHEYQEQQDYLNATGKATPEMLYFMNITLTVFYTCFYGITIIAIADAIFSIMLIIGAQKEKRVLVLPWVMEQLALMPVWVLLMLAFVVTCFVYNQLLVSSITVVVVAVRIGVTLYAVLVAYGLHEYLRRHEVPIYRIGAV